MTPLERALRERIGSEGPIRLDAYMEACNAYYYATRDPFGPGGDFVTAPEISQMFGELVGAALADCWKRARAPAAAVYAELGPGRGTLAADALKVLRSSGFAGEAHFVETSPVLREAQQRAVPDGHWHEAIDELPPRPLLLVANEFLDALPIRQAVGGVDRRVMVAAGGLAFDRDGEVIETSPVRDEAVEAIASHLAKHGGGAFLIDYGHERSAAGDTLQSVSRHRFASVLEKPGEQDLTSHVDFEAVAAAGRKAGAAVSKVVSQGEWLHRLGINARAQALSRAHPDRLDELNAAIDRLCRPSAMGSLFKVIGLHSRAWPEPAGLA